MPSSILIVDDSEIVRTVMRNFIETLTDWRIGGEAEDGSGAIQKAVKLKPDLIPLDFSMPNMIWTRGGFCPQEKIAPRSYCLVHHVHDVLGSTLISAAGIDLVVPKSEGLSFLVESVERLIENNARL